jgi:hypothetical protein
MKKDRKNMKNEKIQFKNDYFNNAVLKQAFYIFVKKKFGLDFSKAHHKKLDFSKFIPFSAFDGEECIASIVVFFVVIYLFIRFPG